MKILIILQNAWSIHHAGKVWHRQSWLKALHASRSGQRLRSLSQALPEAAEVRHENASPKVGDNPDSFFTADVKHIRRLIRKHAPEVVIALGKEPGNGVLAACPDHKKIVLAPHPAFRLLTNDLYRQIGEDIAGNKISHRVTVYTQDRGKVRVEKI
jgi:hypothetical protein